jgi:hypothetical protein
VLVGASLAAGAAGAQGMSWSYNVVLCGWVPAMDVSVETRFGDVEIGMKMTTFGGYATDRVHETEAVAIDIDTGLNAASNRVEDRGVSQSASWVDPVLAARVIAPFGEKWFATPYADAGGFITDDSATWQAVGTVGYRFDARWAARFGYRDMSVEKEIDGRDVDVDLYGPLIGAAFQF